MNSGFGGLRKGCNFLGFLDLWFFFGWFGVGKRRSFGYLPECSLSTVNCIVCSNNVVLLFVCVLLFIEEVSSYLNVLLQNYFRLAGSRCAFAICSRNVIRTPSSYYHI